MSGVSLSLIKSTSQKLQAMNPVVLISGNKPYTKKSSIATLPLLGKSTPPAETQEEINRLQSALALLSPNTGRGNGSFYDSKGSSEADYWLASVWAIASLGWSGGEVIARNWSKQSNRYTEDGFNQAWCGYKPNHPKAVGIGSLYKKAKDLGWQQSEVQAPSIPMELVSNTITEPARFPLLSLDDLDGLQPSEWLVKNVLPTKGLAAIYGPSGSGKTFVVVDLLMAIACKPAWFGFKVKNVPVVYIGLEGKSGIPRRFKAWRKKNSQSYPDNVKVILSSFNVLVRNQIEGLADTIQQANMTSGVIVIDTLNQASPGSDENSSQDMSTIISHLKMLQELTGSLVLIIHHTGKNTAAGLRGHSSLKAALDTSIEVIGGDKRSWQIDKNKDGADGQRFPFNLEVQTLGVDADSESITSCTIERNTNVIFQKPEPSGQAQKAAYKLIKQILATTTDFNKCNSGTQTACIKVEDAVVKLSSTLTTLVSNKRNNRARTIVCSLTEAGYLGTGLELDEGWIWLP